MKMRSLWIPVILLILSAGILPVTGTTTDENKDLIHVTGSGTVKTAPDRVDISFSVVTKNTDVKAAQKENARKMELIMAIMKDPSKGNINPLDIQTTSYSVSEVYPDETLKAKYGDQTVYQVSNTIQIETSEIDRVGDIIDYAVTNGANAVNSLDFTISKEKTQEIRKEALDIAASKARADAEIVAQSMGITLGQVHEVSVDEGYQPPVYVNQDLRNYEFAAAKPSTPIEAGAVEVSARVSISYAIT